MTTNKKSLIIIAGFVLLAVAILGFVLFVGSEKPRSTVKPPVSRPSEPRTATQPQPDTAAVIDNRRRNAASATLAMLQSYASGNTGSYPTTAAALREAVDTYGKTIASSTTVVYKQSYSSAEVPGATDMFYYPGYRCEAGRPVASVPRSVAVGYVLGDSTYECIDNS